ncbi:hypothetical protein PybrP1_007929 [[Pythium] brassicae (nom. inval.)]|nr:hypothetical protein PybrP1_007929 [[Pythium] brassicae (nom. inval.)]
MTLLDDYRRAVYSSSSEERQRRLQPANAIGKNKRLKATSIVRLHGLPSDLKCQLPPPENDRQATPQPLKRSVKLKLASKKKSLTPAAVRTSNQHDADVASSNATATTPPGKRRDSLLEKISVLSAITVGRGGGEEAGGTASRTPKELPSQFIHHAHVNISKWTVIVSDTTLIRIAARNKRIARAKQRQLLALEQPAGVDGVVSWGDDSLHGEEPTRSLVVNGAESITDAGLQAIADSVPTLEALEIAGAVEVTDAGLRTLALSCPGLARLNISNCRGIRGPGLGAIGDHAHRLTELAVADCSHLGEWVLLRCVYGFTLLEHLNVARCSQISDHVLKTVAHQCHRLRSLVASDCPQVSDVGVVHVAQKCHWLEKLALSRAQSTEKITDTCCAALGEHCPALREVNLAGCNFLTDAAIKWLADGCRALECLDVSNVFYLTDVSMRALGAQCPELRSLRLPNVKNVSDVGLRLLAGGCPRLETLHVSNLYLVSDGSNRDFGLEGLRAVASECKMLRDVNLSGCFQLVERALVALGAGCPQLQKLSLKACPKVTLLAVTALVRGCQLLVSLNLSGVLQCTNAMLAAVGAHCPRLRELSVAQCDRVSDAGVRHLAPRADQFQVLDFSGCLLLSDAGLSHLLDAFQSPKLEHLYLAGCALITQDSIARLAFACPLLLTLSVHSASGAVDMGIFPMHRAKDRRFVDETCAEWLAVVKIQVGWPVNLFRSRRARALALVRKEEATRLHVARRLQSIWRGRRARREALVKRAVRSGLERFATKIQHRYRASRRGRKAQREVQVVHGQQLDKYARAVQRRYRAKRAAKVARLIVAAKRREREREVRAATQLQRRFRGLAGRKRVNLLRLQRQVREREERDASLRIQSIYRGRADRKKAKELQRLQERETEHRHQRATQLQAQFRRRKAKREAEVRREAVRARELAATKLQLAFRARKARQTVDVLRLASYHRECQRAARAIQRRWRTRKDRVGLAIVLEVRRQRGERQTQAATFLQRTFRRFLIRRRARAVLVALLKLRQNAADMETWAATLVQAHWRRTRALEELQRAQAAKRSRWKQLVDTYNQHGMGFGAPFYYNQVTQQIRWRMPRELLALVARPGCDQCEQRESASVECATCSEYFCDECHEVVHGRGRRRLHATRQLFNYYGVRRDYGDGEFPSEWPSEVDQDRARGYDFVALAPTESYQDMLWQIAQFVPVATGAWEEATERVTDASAASVPHVGAELFRESDVDEQGKSLWEMFYDANRVEYRQYHRLSKRVRAVPPAQGGELSAATAAGDSESDSQLLAI